MDDKQKIAELQNKIADLKNQKIKRWAKCIEDVSELYRQKHRFLSFPEGSDVQKEKKRIYRSWKAGILSKTEARRQMRLCEKRIGEAIGIPRTTTEHANRLKEEARKDCNLIDAQIMSIADEINKSYPEVNNETPKSITETEGKQ